MKRIAWTYVIAIAGAGLMGAFAIASRSTPTGPSLGPDQEPAEAVAWADREAAEQAKEMDGELHAAIARIIEKGVLADALIHGDRTVEDVAARFRELNAGSPAEYDRPDDDPSVSADEAAYRQVARFVKIRGRADSARVSAVLHALEAEMARRFPPVAAVHAL